MKSSSHMVDGRRYIFDTPVDPALKRRFLEFVTADPPAKKHGHAFRITSCETWLEKSVKFEWVAA